MSAMNYRLIKQGETTVGGIFAMDSTMDNIPANWMPYVGVADCDVSADLAKSLGANVMVNPTDIPNIGRFSVMMDPTGGVFSVLQAAMEPATVE